MNRDLAHRRDGDDDWALDDELCASQGWSQRRFEEVSQMKLQQLHTVMLVRGMVTAFATAPT